MTSISQSLPHIVEGKAAGIWYEEITSLSPTMYTDLVQA